MTAYDVTNPINAYSTHFFAPDGNVPVFIMVYKTGAATFEDVAGYLMFTDQPLAGNFRDRVSPVYQYVVKHFRVSQFPTVLALLQHRLDILKLPMSIHYLGDELEGGWTTLDAGTSPGLDSTLIPLVMPAALEAESSTAPAANAKTKSGRRKKKAKK